MQDERSMILNMLKEGKISVEEADALLEVLAEGDQSEGGGFTAADATGDGAPDAAADSPADSAGNTAGADSRSGPSPTHGGGAEAHIFIDDSDRKHDQHSQDGGEKGSRGFSFDFDFSGLKESLRETMKGVSAAVKDVMGDLSEIDLGGEIFRAMGKIRAESSSTVTESAAGATRLVIKSKWGDVRVTGDDTDTITVHAKATSWGADQAEADAAIERVDVHLRREEDGWILLSGLEESATGRVRIDYEIVVPRHMAASVSSMSGDIWIEELEGEQSIKTLSGDITIADLGTDPARDQVMKTKSGDVVGGALTGDISLNSLSGDVEINGFTGNLQVMSQSGDITIQDGAGSVQLKTMSGSIEASLRTLGTRPVTVASVSGDVELEIPGDCAVDVTVKNTSGDIDLDVDMEFEKRTDHLVTGRKNGGGLEVTVSTVSGDIEVSD